MTQTEIDKAVSKVLSQLKKDGWDVRLRESGRRDIVAAFKKVGQWGGSMVSEGFAFDVGSPAAVKAIEKIAEGFSKTATDTALSEIKKVLSDGLAEGKPIAEVQKAMRGLYDEAWKDRADMIARTETMRAANSGLVEGWKQSGVVTGKEWLVSADACPACLEMSGTIVGLEDSFLTKGESVSYKDESGNEQALVADYGDVDAADLHPNCRCSLVAITVPLD